MASVTAGLAIYDTMQFLTCDVTTYCLGMAASMGAVLLCAGTKGKRFALAEFRHHDPPGLGRCAGSGERCGAPGRLHVQAQKAPHSASSRSTPANRKSRSELDSDRDYYMSADEAKAYGLVDEVIKSRKEIKLLDGSTPPDGRLVEVR